jgi:multidrug transporter EmrE-like cation transporter
MNLSTNFALSLAVILSLLTILGDILIKNSSLKDNFIGWKLLVIGSIIYGLTAFGWFFVMRSIKLSTLGVWYALFCMLGLTLISVFFYQEKLNIIEVIGIILACISVILMARFA